MEGLVEKPHMRIPDCSASARARSISIPLASTTVRPWTDPTWKPALGIARPTARTPGVLVGGEAAVAGIATAAAATTAVNIAFTASA